MSSLAADGGDAAGIPYRTFHPFPSSERRSDDAAEDREDMEEDLHKRLSRSRRLLADLIRGQTRSHASGVGADPSGAGRANDVTEEAIAEDLGLPFMRSLDAERLIVRDRDLLAGLKRPGGIRLAMMENADAPAIILIAPDRASLPLLRAQLRARPGLRRRLRVVGRRTLRDAFVARARRRLLRSAREGLFDRFPEFSARIVVNAWQGGMIGAGMVLLPTSLALAWNTTVMALQGFFSLLFFCCVFLRLAAVRRARPISHAPLAPVNAAELPVYTLLVALRHEAEIVPDLLLALSQIRWPRNKLEIKLVCEADDAATLQALEAQPVRPYVEIVRVPAAAPRTKPKALAYALQLCSGEFIALYDAEDRPHPLQLIEAWQCFRAADPLTACLQAPLVISNWNRGLLPRMFAFEYAALFRGLLPWLSHKGFMFPLGGTSNHFRRSALEEVGGWDPYNVTEDADLGLRLHRFGYRTATITRPTYEDAPDDVAVWVRQRTRWFKGWLQTWLVHMRNPGQMARELGTGSFLVSQIMFAGMVASALVHPLLIFALVAVLAKIAWVGEATLIDGALLAVNSLNLACGYLAFLTLGQKTLDPQECVYFGKVIRWTPLYWLLMSAAAWRSVWQLYRHPHLWEKTPHRPHRAAMADARD